MTVRVACLGPEGTVSHEALEGASRSSDREVEPLFTATINDAVGAVATGEADFALVPLENSLEGGVATTLDELLAREGTTPIVGELIHPVRHMLVAAPGTGLEDVGEVLTLPFVADQCGPWLRKHLPGAVITPAASTADAVRSAADSRPGTAALGSSLAAAIYGCEILAEDVDRGGNSTRFVWLAADADGDLPPGASAGGKLKTSIVFWGSGAEEPGWLVECLNEFGSRNVNLTRIESRPTRAGLGSYVFFADIDGGADDGSVAAALDGLATRADAVVMLGTYVAAAGSGG